MANPTSTDPSTLPPPPPYTSVDSSAPSTASFSISPRAHNGRDAKDEAEELDRLFGVPEPDRQRIAAWVDGEVERILTWAESEKQRIARRREACGDAEGDAALVRLEQQLDAGFERVEKERQASLERVRKTAT